MHWETLYKDIRYAVRSFRRDAGFFATAVLIMGLGIGANTAIFSVVNALLFRPLPFQSPERLVWIANTGAEGGLSSETSRVANYIDWQRLNRSFESLASYFAFFDYGSYNLIGLGEPERLVGVGVSKNFLGFLGVQPEARPRVYRRGIEVEWDSGRYPHTRLMGTPLRFESRRRRTVHYVEQQGDGHRRRSPCLV